MSEVCVSVCMRVGAYVCACMCGCVECGRREWSKQLDITDNFTSCFSVRSPGRDRDGGSMLANKRDHLLPRRAKKRIMPLAPTIGKKLIEDIIIAKAN